jgi:hypothetical protein
VRSVARLASALLALVLLAPPAHAVLRSPQVPVSGTALATFFASQGQAIAVVGDQIDLQSASFTPGISSIEFRAVHPASAVAGFGGYNAGLVAPPLYQLMPSGALSGWFTMASFRTAPTRLVVNLFDNNAAIQGTTTYLGADPSAFGFHAQGPLATVYSQDARNAGGARILSYAGTGAHAGSTWFACEFGTEPTGDFADFVVLVTFSNPPVATERSTWGRVKNLFR